MCLKALRRIISIHHCNSNNKSFNKHFSNKFPLQYSATSVRYLITTIILPNLEKHLRTAKRCRLPPFPPQTTNDFLCTYIRTSQTYVCAGKSRERAKAANVFNSLLLGKITGMNYMSALQNYSNENGSLS